MKVVKHMKPMTAGVTPAGQGLEGIVWNILGQIYVPKQVSESSFSWHATFPAGTFVPPHIHPTQDEFIYVLEGHPTLVTDEGQTPLQPGMCAGMKAGTGNAHQLANNTDSDVVYLEMGDRSAGDEVTYPDDDLLCVMSSDGQRLFTRKNGKPY